MSGGKRQRNSRAYAATRSPEAMQAAINECPRAVANLVKDDPEAAKMPPPSWFSGEAQQVVKQSCEMCDQLQVTVNKNDATVYCFCQSASFLVTKLSILERERGCHDYKAIKDVVQREVRAGVFALIRKGILKLPEA